MRERHAELFVRTKQCVQEWNQSRNQSVLTCLVSDENVKVVDYKNVGSNRVICRRLRRSEFQYFYSEYSNASVDELQALLEKRSEFLAVSLATLDGAIEYLDDPTKGTKRHFVAKEEKTDYAARRSNGFVSPFPDWDGVPLHNKYGYVPATLDTYLDENEARMRQWNESSNESVVTSTVADTGVEIAEYKIVGLNRAISRRFLASMYGPDYAHSQYSEISIQELRAALESWHTFLTDSRDVLRGAIEHLEDPSKGRKRDYVAKEEYGGSMGPCENTNSSRDRDGFPLYDGD